MPLSLASPSTPCSSKQDVPPSAQTQISPLTILDSSPLFSVISWKSEKQTTTTLHTSIPPPAARTQQRPSLTGDHTKVGRSSGNSSSLRTSISTSLYNICRCKCRRRQRRAYPFLVRVASPLLFVLLSILLTASTKPTNMILATAIPSASPTVPYPFTNQNDVQSTTSSFYRSMIAAGGTGAEGTVLLPIDFSTLGQMAVLGDFDALTPVVTMAQQNTFESNVFSILEMIKVPLDGATAGGTAAQKDKILSVPVLLASFSADLSSFGPSNTTSKAHNTRITATCVLNSVPHQVYVGGYFEQAPLVTSTQGTDNSSNGSGPSSMPITGSRKTGLNYIGMYDSKLKRFLPLGNGLDGPVENLWCDSETDQVYVVGKFRAPLQDKMTFNGSSSSNYQQLGSFGGGVAVWHRIQDSVTSSLSPSPDSVPSDNNADDSPGATQTGQHHTRAQAAGSWVSLPFKGLNGVVRSVAKAQDGTFYFGGHFDTTADGESFSSPDSQPVNMDKVLVTTGNGVDPSQDKNIICNSQTSTRSNWIMRDNIPGYWRVEFPFYITPTLFRLWNVDASSSSSSAQGSLLGSADRGTKSFSIMAQPSNQVLNLSYVDPITHIVQYCTVCTLSPSTASAKGYSDFIVATPKLLQAAQIDVLSWYGAGGGLGGIEVFQSEIFVRAVDELNYSPRCCSSTCQTESDPTQENDGDNNNMNADSSFLGADWKTMVMTAGWQTVLAASVSATDEAVRRQAYVDMSPYLQESGMYDVYLYTPACSSGPAKTDDSKGTATNGLPSNSCASRGWVDVHMYFASPESMITTTISQTNTVDKYDKIYSGMITRSTPDFRPHVVVGPSLSKMGAMGGGVLQTVIVDSIQFVKQATLNNTNSLLFYRPATGTGDGATTTKDTITETTVRDKVQGLDSSLWGNLPTQLPSGAAVNSLVTYFGAAGAGISSSSSAELLFIGGIFQSTGYNNIIAWDGKKLVPLGQQGTLASASGLDGTVSGMTLYHSDLYVVGAFQQPLSPNSGTGPLGGLALYNIQTSTWSSFGNATQNFQPGSQFTSVQLSESSTGSPQLIVGGNFKWTQQQTQDTFASIAVWDINSQRWIHQETQVSGNRDNEFPFGHLHGQISYFNRVSGSSADGIDGVKVVLVAGTIDSLDTYEVRQPENMAWLTAAGKLKTVNLSPAISMTAPVTSNNTAEAAILAAASTQSPIAQAPVLPKTGAGIIYFNRTSQQWITIVGGAHADGSIGAGYFYTPAVPSPTQDTLLSYKDLDLKPALASSSVLGEILALGLHKDESTGYGFTGVGGDLLLIGGAFKSVSPGINGIALYDLETDQVVPSTIMPVLRGTQQGQDPVINVMKSHPRGGVVLAGDFAGVGTDVICELVCIWNPEEARKALEKKNPLSNSFKSLYGGSGSSKHLGAIKGVINDIAFEDDKNMFVAGDLVVAGVPCGVASFNFDSSKWTTFGSMINSAYGAGATAHPLGPNTLTGPVTAIAHDTSLHQFFISGRSSTDGSAYFKKWIGDRFISVSSEFLPTSDVHRIEILPASKNAPLRTATTPTSSCSGASIDSADTLNLNPNGGDSLSSTPPLILSSPASTASAPTMTSTPSTTSGSTSTSSESVGCYDSTYILEQGYVLLVSGRIILGSSSGPIPSVGNGYQDYQELSLAFFDGESWFPFLQSSRNASLVGSIDITPPPSGATTPRATNVDPGSNFLFSGPTTSQQSRSEILQLVKRDISTALPLSAAVTSDSSSGTSKTSHRLRDQGVFRALAIAHLPRIIARDYLSLSYIILISAAIALGLIFLIVLFGFLFVWIRRRLSKDPSVSRPLLGTSFMEDKYDGHRNQNRYGGRRDMEPPSSSQKGDTLNEKSGRGVGFMFFGGSRKTKGPENSSAILAALGISGAVLESPTTFRRDNDNSPSLAGSDGGQFRPNSTIAQATDALVTEFVRSHSQQLAGGSSNGSLPRQQRQQQQQQQQQQRQDRAKDSNAPPSPDRRSKKSRHSAPFQHHRDSNTSALTNPLGPGDTRYSTLLAADYEATSGSMIGASSASATPALSAPTTRIGGGVFYYAKYPFRAREIGELGFQAGERILVVDMSDDVWWMGVIQDASGQQMHGVFPSNYVGLTQ